ncbi:MAG TPA: glucokinase [Burkholderiaceae bacterium]|jgi:glucokinase
MIESIVNGKLVMKRFARREQAPRLLADIGGTNARFALETAPGEIEAIAVLPCSAYASLGLAMQSYLSSPAAVHAGADQVTQAALAIAAAVDGGEARMTNHHWTISSNALAQEFGFATVNLINDFKALALAIPLLLESEKRQIGGGSAKVGGVVGLVGPGTGFGVSALIPCKGEWIALETEGGHANFAPANEVEDYILQYAWREHPHVSVERLLSGIGLPIIYRALAVRAGIPEEQTPLTAQQIVERSLDGQCGICGDTVEAFCGMLGNAAANVALTLGATGGVYIGGGIVPRLGNRFAQSEFRRRFEKKGRFCNYMEQIPTTLITADYPAFHGLRASLGAMAGPSLLTRDLTR